MDLQDRGWREEANIYINEYPRFRFDLQTTGTCAIPVSYLRPVTCLGLYGTGKLTCTFLHKRDFPLSGSNVRSQVSKLVVNTLASHAVNKTRPAS